MLSLMRLLALVKDFICVDVASIARHMSRALSRVRSAFFSSLDRVRSLRTPQTIRSLIELSVRVSNSHDNSCKGQEDVFKYELCSYPPALFDSALLLREPQKPQLADAIWTLIFLAQLVMFSTC